MAGKFSAYLSIYNDWDILPVALRSIASHVDELVVVDGAYEWMTPYLNMLGVDPARSDPRVYAALEASGIPFRVISQAWKNEPEKRQAGYEACAHDYIYRVDADEVMFFDDTVLESALSEGLAVGEMSMPNYVVPGWIACANDLSRIERQCFFFDRRQVSSQSHLNYLWLILTADKLPLAGNKTLPIYPRPLAFNAHLTAWRTPRTGVNRASFYMLNWMRQHGVPWLPELRDKPLADLRALFDIVSPTAFLSSLSRGRIAFGMIEARGSRTFAPSPLGTDQEAHFIDVFQIFLASLAAKNRQAAAEAQPFLTPLPTLLDLSTPDARRIVAPAGMVSLRFSEPLISAKAHLLTYATDGIGNEERDLPVTLNGADLNIELPEPTSHDLSVLRKCLEFYVWPKSSALSQTFQVR
jgi:hypothetical protein